MRQTDRINRMIADVIIREDLTGNNWNYQRARTLIDRRDAAYRTERRYMANIERATGGNYGQPVSRRVYMGLNNG
jgi:hypothetical protein